MSQFEFVFNVSKAYPHLFKHNEVMIHEVACFINKAVAIAINSLNDAFGTFLAHLFSNSFDAFYKQTGGVRPFGHFGTTLRYECGQ